MSTDKLMLEALHCREVPRRPLWVMRQAGRFLPEYRKLKEQYTFEQLSSDPDLAAAVTMLPFDRFAFDAAIVFADLMTPLPALGIECRFNPGPVLEKKIDTPAAVRALPAVAEQTGTPVPATLQKVREKLDDSIALLGFGGAPWTLACYVIEGKGTRGFLAARAFMHEHPVEFGELLDKLATLVARYLIEQHRAGADAVQIFDSWAGLLSAEDWNTHVRGPLTRLLDELGQAGVPRIMFANEAPHLVDEYASLPSECLALCWRSDLAEVRRRIGNDKALQGNLDPAVLLAGPEATVRATRKLLDSVPARGHVVNLGHGITPETPLESVQALVETVHANS